MHRRLRPPIGRENGTPGQPVNGNGRSQDMDDRRNLIRGYLSQHGLTYREKSVPGGTALILSQCPFNESHGKDGESAIFVSDAGMITYQCMHNSCSGRKLADVIAKYGPLITREHPQQPAVVGQPTTQLPAIAVGTIVQAGDRGNYGTVVTDHGVTCSVHFRSPEGHTATKELPKSELRTQDGSPIVPSADPPPFTTSLLTSKEFDETAYTQEFLIEHVLVAGQPCVGGGRSKTLKTSLIGIDMAVSLGTGTPFLGHFCGKAMPCRVLVGRGWCTDHPGQGPTRSGIQGRAFSGVLRVLVVFTAEARAW